MKALYRILAGAIVITLAVFFFKFLIGSNGLALFSPAGSVASAQSALIKESVLIMLIVVIPVFILLFTFAWKYRAGNNKANYDPEQSHGAGRELILWAIPAVIVAVLATLTWSSAHALDPYKPIDSGTPPITIKVVALPWKWLFIYPAQNIATVNFIQFPAGTPVHFELTADGPISSFWIPQLGSQIYAMAAMQTQLNLIASTTGEYIGKDTEINGAGYAGMTFTAKSISQADFDAWVAEVKQSSNPLDAKTYDALAAPSEYNPPAYYSTVETGLYDTIIMKFMSPSSTGGQAMPAMPGMHM